jgi:flagellin
MALESVNTNMGAMVALQSLESTQQQLSVTQKQISTGYRVADSTDDGAAYAIAQGIRSTVGALTSANQQLGTVSGLLSTTQTGLNNISNTMASMRDTLVKLSDSTLSSDERNSYITQYQAQAALVKTDVQNSAYNGISLIGNITGSVGGGTISNVTVPANEFGATYGVASMSGSAIYNSINFSAAQLGSATTVQALITATGTFLNQQNTVGTDLNTVGSSINFVSSQTSYNSDKINSLNSGLGSLVDADLAKESAQLTALQIRQQLGTQALSLANQAPQSLLSLFK